MVETRVFVACNCLLCLKTSISSQKRNPDTVTYLFQKPFVRQNIAEPLPL